MALVLGIDPGFNGAFAVYDDETRRIVGDIIDMPIWFQAVGKRKRKRLDTMAVADLFDTYQMMGVELIVMENVGGRAREGGSGSFQFGYGVGVVYMAAFYSGVPIDTVLPATWKQMMNVPGKAKADDSAIMQRANEMFPEDRDKFSGPRGGKRLDRAEAAMLAKFGADRVLPTMQKKGDIELRIAYSHADTGG